jgi:glycosyltransferase involved in cell wall biosynthesis
MEIVLLAPAVPPVVGGSETTVETVALELLARGHRVHLLCGNEPVPRLGGPIRAAGGEVMVLGHVPPADSVPWEWLTFSRAATLSEFCRDRPIDVVHCFSHDTALTAGLAGDGSVPIVATFSEMATFRSAAGRSRTAFVLGKVEIDVVVAASEYFERALTPYLASGTSLRQVVFGVDVDYWWAGDARAGRALLGVDAEVPVLVCPSRLSERKGQLDLVRAVAGARGSWPADRPPVVVLTGSVNSGSAAYLRRLETLIRDCGLTGSVRLRLEEDRDDLRDLLAAADIVVQPSHFEGLGTAALEAMAAGAAVLLTRTTGFDEISTSAEAYFVDVADPPQLAAGLVALLRDPELRRRLGQHAQRRIRERYSARTTGEQLEKIYREVVTGTGSG